MSNPSRYRLQTHVERIILRRRRQNPSFSGECQRVGSWRAELPLGMLVERFLIRFTVEWERVSTAVTTEPCLTILAGREGTAAGA